MRIEGMDSLTKIDNIKSVNRSLPREESIGKEYVSVDKYSVECNSETKRYTEKELIEAIEAANDKIEIYNTRLEFSIHEKTKEIMVKIINSTNDEVIKEIPPEKILDIIAGLMELAGIIVDERV